MGPQHRCRESGHAGRSPIEEGSKLESARMGLMDKLCWNRAGEPPASGAALDGSTLRKGSGSQLSRMRGTREGGRLSLLVGGALLPMPGGSTPGAAAGAFSGTDPIDPVLNGLLLWTGSGCDIAAWPSEGLLMGLAPRRILIGVLTKASKMSLLPAAGTASAETLGDRAAVPVPKQPAVANETIYCGKLLLPITCAKHGSMTELVACPAVNTYCKG